MTNTVTALEDVETGAILADKYRIVKVLGQGGMGIVVEAEHVRLGERVAIKFLSSTAVLDREARDRFEREARAAVLLQSEHVARVRDVGELSTGQPYIVMDLLRPRFSADDGGRAVSARRCREPYFANVRSLGRSTCRRHRASGS